MPNRPLRPCPERGCPELVQAGRCPLHSRTREQDRRLAWVTTFYNSTAWKKLRALKRSLDPLCEGDEGTPCPAQREAETVDHVIPITTRPDLRLSIENLRSLCHPCHNAKTRRGG